MFYSFKRSYLQTDPSDSWSVKVILFLEVSLSSCCWRKNILFLFHVQLISKHREQLFPYIVGGTHFILWDKGGYNKLLSLITLKLLHLCHSFMWWLAVISESLILAIIINLKQLLYPFSSSALIKFFHTCLYLLENHYSCFYVLYWFGLEYP